MTTGMVHSFETLGALDGPGLRLVVFLSGCPLRCLYCHNPDTWDPSAGTAMTAGEVMDRILRLKPYFSSGGGGVTLSGGEPLLQAEFVLELMALCRDSGIHVCLDTAGGVCNGAAKQALKAADLVLLDVKHTDPEAYRALTAQPQSVNRAVLDFCRREGVPLWIRQVILPGWNDSEAQIQALSDYVRGANVQKLELLPYHAMGRYKWEALGLRYALDGVSPPSDARMDSLRKVISL